MEQAEFERRLAEADSAVFRASIVVRQHRAELDQIKQGEDRGAAIRAQALLDMLEDTLRRRIADRAEVLRSRAITGARDKTTM